MSLQKGYYIKMRMRFYTFCLFMFSICRFWY